MKTRQIIFIGLLVMSLMAQTKTDTLRHFGIHELTFHSALEQSSFAFYKTGNPGQRLMQALATDPSATFEQYKRIHDDFFPFLDNLKLQKKFSSRPRTQVKFLFKAIHDRYFKLYQENPYFREIFLNGNFNCLTATILFAISFDYLEIPYQTILTPNHSYLLAYPNQQSIIVETTNPAKGVIILFDQSDKVSAVQSLLDMKLVAQEEVANKGVDQVFSENYLAMATPDMDQLIGALYSNKAYKAAENLGHLEAYELFKKSSVLFPRKIITAMLVTQGFMVLSQNDLQRPETYRVLADMEKFTQLNVPKSLIIGQAIAFLNELMRLGRIAQMDSAYQWLYERFTDQEIKDEISFEYHYARAVKAYTDIKRQEALNFLEVAYSLKPEEEYVNNLIVETVMSMIKANWSFDENYRLSHEIKERFPGILANRRFLLFNQMVILELMNHHYTNSNFAIAEKYRAEFEEQFTPENVDMIEVLRYIEETYSRASLYYFRANRRAAARDVLTSGLNYVPDSFDLKAKMGALR